MKGGAAHESARRARRADRHFLIALLDLPGDAWPDLAAALPDELFDRVDRYLTAHLSEGA